MISILYRVLCLTAHCQYLKFKSHCSLIHSHRHRVHTEWQWPLPGVHSIKMVKPAQPGEAGGCTPPPFTLHIYLHKQSTLQLRGQIPNTLPLFILHRYMYSVFTRALKKSHLEKYTKSLSVSPPGLKNKSSTFSSLHSMESIISLLT